MLQNASIHKALRKTSLEYYFSVHYATASWQQERNAKTAEVIF